jgi:hypothetical protein
MGVEQAVDPPRDEEILEEREAAPERLCRGD